nr:uncharacterized protein LOC123753239 [Procambarus clarkii]
MRLLVMVGGALLVAWCRAAAVSPHNGEPPGDATSIRSARRRGPVLAYHHPLGFFRGISPDAVDATSYSGPSHPAHVDQSSYFSRGNIKPSIHGFGGGRFLGNDRGSGGSLGVPGGLHRGFDGSTNDLDGPLGSSGGAFKDLRKSIVSVPGFIRGNRGSFGVPRGYNPSFKGFGGNYGKQLGLGK